MKSAAKTVKSAQTKERIYAAALSLFRTRGFHETTMRDIAREAELSPGAAYYYFRSKDEIALEFYLRIHADLDRQAAQCAAESKDFRLRLRGLIDYQLAAFEPHRKFLSVLYQNSVDPESPLSPFGSDTAAIRRDSIQSFGRILAGGNVPAAGRLAPHLAYLLWLFDLGILLFWIFDSSPGRGRTSRLLELSIEILWQLLKIQRLPFARRLLGSVLRLLDEFNFLPARA